MSKFIAKEGYAAIFLALFLFFIVWIFLGFSWIFLVLFLFFVFLFRKNKFELLCNDEKALLSPISGRVTKIENIKHSDLGECVVLNIKNAFYDCGTLLAPTKMHIKNLNLKHGLFLCSELEAAKDMNERVDIEAASKDKKFILQIRAGSMDRKLKLTPPNYNLERGCELGFLLNGSVSLFLPRDTRIYVGLNDSIKAGSLLGYLA